ncbi:FadR/GntR family transcriptional regulator [Desulfohalovibrio reitneri]|uniref:FadR/GntR family transcriptional regulator n=1 Tax=Desulfohalovibrio reitneri TaxID=1307759 RepID=UPI0004A735BB|nr:FadR/GntR family transcriptional regulator [Desulfohalovibrio reitneri]
MPYSMPSAVRRGSVSGEVAERIRAMLAENNHAPGDRLPTERRMAEAFGVSRNSVREAIRVLADQGVLVSKAGSGTYVADVGEDELARALTGVLSAERKRLRDIFQVRLLLEPQIAALAAANRTGDDVAELRRILDAQRRAVEARADGSAEDETLHARLAAMTGNPVLEKLTESLAEILDESRSEGLQPLERRAASVEAHERIVAAIEQGDAPAAEAAMREHLESIQGLLFPNG